MKIFISISIVFISLFTYGQTEIILAVDQPPELGFTVSTQDASILSGESIVLGNDISVFGGSGNYKYYWSPGKSLNDSTLLTPVAKPVATTTYILTVSDVYGCSFSISNTVRVQVFPTNTTSEITTNQGLQAILFPNPNIGSFKVELSGEPQKKIDLTVMDIFGRIIQKKTISNFSGDFTENLEFNLSAGIYTLLVNSEKQTLQRQFIIK